MLEHIPMNTKVLRAWLHSGFIDRGKSYPTTQGVPQGGVISPVIGNMVLDGLERCLQGSRGSKHRGAHNINFVRYADDCVPRRHAGGRSPPCSHAAQVMGAGPPKPPYRRRLQTTHCCCL